MSQTRRLAAILAADVAGYSRLTGAPRKARLSGEKGARSGALFFRRVITLVIGGAAEAWSAAPWVLRLCLLGRFLFCRAGDRGDGLALTGSGFAGNFFRHGHSFYLSLIEPRRSIIPMY